ncbi:hypothetical protein ES708_17848 [subsurface metagenome]
MKGNQGDEEIIEKLCSYLIANFNPKLEFKIKELLKNILPEPESKWLKKMWRFGHADISVYRHDKLICIVEPGGWHHFKDGKQILNDKKKYILCKLNSVNVLRIVNDVVENDLGLLKTKRLFKKYFYGKNLK